MSNRSLADQYNDIDLQIKALEKQKDEIRDKIINLGTDLLEGDECSLKISLSQRSLIDFDLLERNHGVTQEQYKLYSACKKEGEPFYVIKVTRK